MKMLSIASVILAFGTGITAAWYWWKASTLVLEPMWETEPGERDAAQDGWIGGILQNAIASSAANAIAAKWTAASVFFSCIASVFGIL